MRFEGSAFLDRAGRVIAADDTFRSCLELPAGDVTAALQSRAEGDAVLRALLAGEGDDLARVDGPGGTVDLCRSACAEGLFLRAFRATGLAGPVLEHAMHSAAVARIAGGVAHDVKNPLNALVLQIALLTDKIGGAGEELANGCADNLARMKVQIGRVNDVVRRLADVADPGTGTSFDAGALASDLGSLFGHDFRRHRVELACEVSGGGVQARGDPGRATRALLGLLWRALSAAPEGAHVALRAFHDGDEAVISLEQPAGADPALEWITEVARTAAADLGGRLAHERDADTERLELRLRRENAA
jgi:signal transduction histidine kinase